MTPFGKCPSCRLPLVQSTKADDEAVCDSGHRFRYETIIVDDHTEYHIGTYVGKDSPS